MVHSLLRWTSVVVLGFLVLPVLAADKDLDKDKDKKDPGYRKVGQVTGKLLGIDESKRSLRVQVDVPKLNPSAVQGLAQAQLQLQQAQFQQNPQSRLQAIMNAQRSIAQHQAQMWTKESKTVELATIDDVKVRLKDPPTRFDEKGQIVKPSAKELKELKGNDSSLPGYQAEFSDLHADQFVTLTLVQRKDQPKPKPAGPKAKDADAQLLLQQNLPEVSLIYVIAEWRMPGR